jgi:hypothetical protein
VGPSAGATFGFGDGSLDETCAIGLYQFPGL